FHTSENSKIILQDIFGNEYNLFQQLFSKSYLLVPENSKIILQDIFGNEYNLFQQLFSKSYLLVPLIESEPKNLQDSIVEIKQYKTIQKSAPKTAITLTIPEVLCLRYLLIRS
ncbi:hypothetical protein DWY36_13730, partial [Firmicutes bacterium AF25-13AC]